jgi:lipopolysaccharide transport system ATP-binding protein
MADRDIALSVENISKIYRIGLADEDVDTAAKALINFLKTPLKNFRKYRSLYQFDDKTLENDELANQYADIIWALRDVSFKVPRGEVLGIIGRNGAGKSTMLKILSKITQPTRGRAEIRGRVSSLLEVGTGFHPELTGRENVFLNGTVLGMKKKEIDKKFDAIVDFSGVRKFIDTPVKRYSSGMTVRLAFSIAAHLEPQILIVDEVLAVGDIEFQKKCLGKMNEVAKAGRTVIFVSHNMSAISNLCDSVLWLDEGKMVMSGRTVRVVREYVRNSLKGSQAGPENWNSSGNKEARLTDIQLLDTEDVPCNAFKMGETVVVQFDIDFTRFFKRIDAMAVEVKSADTGIQTLHMHNQDCGFLLNNIPVGKRRFRVEIPDCMLYPGPYLISVYVGYRDVTLDYVKDVLDMTILEAPVSKRQVPYYPMQAIFHQPSYWEEITFAETTRQNVINL